MPIELQQIVSQCPLCRGQASALFDQRDLHGYRLENRICQSCGLVFLSPRMSQEQLEHFYAEDYRSLYHQRKEPTPDDLAVQSRRAQFLITRFSNASPAIIARHLDIGCSTGTLLNEFSRQYGSTPVGIELDDAHREYASQHGIEAYSSLAGLPKDFEKSFDLVSLVHVLEHLPDPLETLAEVRDRWLKPDGWLLLEVPNLYCHDSFEVAHLLSFSPTTLREVVRQSGFQVNWTITHGQPRSDVLPLYITLLARPHAGPADDQVLRMERAVKIKRQAGLLYRRALTRLMPAKAWKPV